MYKEILRSIAGVDVFPVISLCLFVGVFAIVLARTLRTDKAQLASYAHLPLDDADPATGARAAVDVEHISNRRATL